MKRVVVVREGLESDEDLRAVEHIEEILHATYERKTRGPREGIEGSTPIHISVSVEPINPSMTNRSGRKTPFRQLSFRRRKIAVSKSTQGTKNRGASLGSIIQASTLCGGSSSASRMAGHDPIIRLPESKGEVSKDPEKNLFICEGMRKD
jgi:hypothetical protein